MASANDIPQLWRGLPRCFYCRLPLRCRTHTTQGRAYYVEMHTVRDMECPYAGKSSRTDVWDMQWERILTDIRPPPDWRKAIYDFVRSDDPVVEFRRRRDLWEEKRRRVLEMYLDCEIERDERDRRIAKIEAELAKLGRPERIHTIDVLPYLDSLFDIWQVASPWDRQSWMMQSMRHVYVNSKTNKLVWVEPRPAYQNLFREAGLPEEPEPGFFDVRSFGEGLKRSNRRIKVSPDQIAEMRRLRRENSTKWNLRRLGERFGISHERVRQLLNETG